VGGQLFEGRVAWEAAEGIKSKRAVSVGVGHRGLKMQLCTTERGKTKPEGNSRKGRGG